MKKCYVCSEHKELHLFGNNRSKPDGLQDECKACRTISHKLYARRKAQEKREDKIQAQAQLIEDLILQNPSAVAEALGE